MAKSNPGMRVSEIVSSIERLAPSGTAEKWDNVGLLAGDPEWITHGAVVSVDLTENAIRTAVKKGYRLIVNHHPCIFPKGKGLSRVVPGSKSGISSLVFEAIRNGIAVVACHTNFDQCSLEVIEKVSHGLGVLPKGRLLDEPEGSLLKLVVYVPETHANAVREAVCAAGAGHVGNYDSCTFSVHGEGTFRGGKDTRPFAGKPGKLELAREVRLETVFSRGLKKAVLAAMRSAHPYEEVAFDLYRIEQGPAPIGLVRGLGYGFWGDFTSPKPFPDVMRSVTDTFHTQGFMLTDSQFGSTGLTNLLTSARASSSSGNLGPAPFAKIMKRKVRRLAYVAGKGASFIDAAVAAGCELFITGEAGYHAALDASHKGMAVLELGHRESEVFYITTMAEWLSRLGLKTAQLDLKTQSIRTFGLGGISE